MEVNYGEKHFLRLLLSAAFVILVSSGSVQREERKGAVEKWRAGFGICTGESLKRVGVMKTGV